MKYGQRDVLELKVFDESGKLITVLDTLKESGILTGKENYIFVKDALLDRKLLEFVGKVEENKANDFDKSLSKSKFASTITFNSDVYKKCKVIASGNLRRSDTQEDVEYLIEVPNAIINRNIDHEQGHQVSSEFDLIFYMKSFNEYGDLYKMHI